MSKLKRYNIDSLVSAPHRKPVCLDHDVTALESRALEAEKKLKSMEKIIESYAGLMLTHPHVSGWIAEMWVVLKGKE